MTLQVTEITNLAIDLIGVRKTYRKKVQALRGVNVQVGRGEIFGLLGPNGAGKSTLVKIMMRVVRADAVMGTVLGRPLGNKNKLAVTGYLPESHRFPGYLTGMQVLDFYAALARVPRPVRRSRAPGLLDRMGLTRWADRPTREYSKGMLQRLGISQALMNDPELIVLDEPTDGLDPMGRRDVRSMLLELKKAGKTIFLNSHLLSELEMVCDRVAILNEGLVARQGTLAELTQRTVEYRIRTSGDLQAIRGEIEKRSGTIRNGQIVLGGRDAQGVNELIDLLRQNGHLIEAVEPHRLSLEDIFVEALGQSTAAPAVSQTGGRKA
ncbi:MAG: ABC transporter ATP-binding protein [Phycisphaerales bacterium]|nr:ABC transporter ATP-binding protein [Phycisphaerales bacterium]